MLFNTHIFLIKLCLLCYLLCISVHKLSKIISNISVIFLTSSCCPAVTQNLMICFLSVLCRHLHFGVPFMCHVLCSVHLMFFASHFIFPVNHRCLTFICVTQYSKIQVEYLKILVLGNKTGVHCDRLKGVWSPLWETLLCTRNTELFFLKKQNISILHGHIKFLFQWVAKYCVIPLPGMLSLVCITRTYKNWLNFDRPNLSSSAEKVKNMPHKRQCGTLVRRTI